MGDKTQLATISLAVEYQNMLGVLMGTTLGMVIADAIGIIIGTVMRKHIPGKTIKWISASIFMLFGLSGIYKVLAQKLDLMIVWLIILAVSLGTASAARYLMKPKTNQSALK
jgi:small basic protein